MKVTKIFNQKRYVHSLYLCSCGECYHKRSDFVLHRLNQKKYRQKHYLDKKVFEWKYRQWKHLYFKREVIKHDRQT
jgi:hypothetical protein